MISILNFILIFVVVGVITAFLNIKFDRFFTIIMLLLVAGLAIKASIEIVLWVVFLGAITILLSNKKGISAMPKSNKIKFLSAVPSIVFLSTLFGTYLFLKATPAVLLITLGILAIVYGIRLILFHFEEPALNSKDENSNIAKFCGFFGPIISGISLGFIGTSLKPLKIPFAVKVGNMNLQKVYLGNVIVAAYASFFAIILHAALSGMSASVIYLNFLIGISLWASIHFTSEFSNLFIKQKWRKPVQILVGIVLVLVSAKIFLLV